MRLAHKSSLSSSNVFRRLIFTSSIRLKPKGLPRRIKINSMLDAIAIPAVPKLKPGSFLSKLQKRIPKSGLSNGNVSKEDDVAGMTGIVTGWGSDVLAPPAIEHEKPLHNPKVNMQTIRKFEQEAFYRHGRDSPHFDRRLHLWINGHSAEPTLKQIFTDEPQPPLSKLSHSLDKVLFDAGPHWLRDPQTHVYNFDQWLEHIPDIHDFDYGRLTPYMTSSRDNTLFSLAKRERKPFSGSTSSLTSILSHIYFTISGGRGVDTSVLSSTFANESKEFSYGARWPGAVTLQYKDGHHSIDSQEIDESEKYLLLNMGTMLEKFLTYNESEFTLLRRDTPITEEVAKLQRPEAYRYSTSEKFVMRSQLDAHDPRLPGSGVFDIKTRAAVAIRYDPLNYKNNSGYLIKTTQGAFESFEREQYDLIRSAFLKYIFQVRIGGMDGIFVAYHNTAYMFGFQYFSREDIDDRLFGGTVQGDRVFAKCVKCMEEIMSEVTLCFPGVSVKCYFETSEEGALRIYVEPVKWDGPGEVPIVEFMVTATNYMNGVRVLGPMDYGDVEDDWSILLNITRSSTSSEALESSIRKQKDSLVDRKNEFVFSIPEGVSPTQMAKQWLATDYTSSAKPSDNGHAEEISVETVSARDAKELAQLAHRFKIRSRPSDFVESLRRLAQEGRIYLDGLKSSQAQERTDGSQALESPNKDEGTPKDVNALPLPTERFSRNIDPISSVDNSPLVLGYSRSEQEEGLVEQENIDVPVEETSVHVKIREEAKLAGERGKDESQTLTEVGFGENPVENDNQVPPSVEGITFDILGSEEDELEMLDPTNGNDTNISDQLQPFVDGHRDEVELLDVEDGAWCSRSPTNGTNESAKEESPDDQKGSSPL